MPVSRLAPTPSGHLHLGNALNFILTWWTTRRLGGKIHLRIDDADWSRSRPEFLQDIFESLAWLEIDYDFGPKNVQDFLDNFSQTKKKELYFQEALKVQGAYACACSRKQIQEYSSDGLYPGTCRGGKTLFKRKENAMRVAVPEDEEVKVEDNFVPLGKTVKDFIIWRKDDIPSYQLTSLVDDAAMGVNLVVRGQDLLESSAAQLYLEKRMGYDHLARARFIHHSLVKDVQGVKLSKSQNSLGANFSLKAMREKGKSVKELLQLLSDPLGLGGDVPDNLQELLGMEGPEKGLTFH